MLDRFNEQGRFRGDDYFGNQDYDYEQTSGESATLVRNITSPGNLNTSTNNGTQNYVYAPASYPNEQNGNYLMRENQTDDLRKRNTQPLNATNPTETEESANVAVNTGQIVLTGRLVAFSPSSLLSLLNIQKQTGYLRLQSGGAEGYIYVEKGEVYDAGMGRVSSGALAVFQLFGWRQGEFSFEVGATPPERRTIEASLPVLQVRATLWLDSMNKYSSIIPSSNHRVSLSPEPRSEVVIEPYQWSVLTKIVSRSLSISELAVELNQDLMTVTRITAELVKMGVAIIKDPSE